MDEKQEKKDKMALVVEQGGMHYGFPASMVREVLPMPKVFRLPKQPKPLLGVCNYKGGVVPVVSMAGICSGEETENRACVVLKMKTGELLALGVERAIKTTEEQREDLDYDMSLMNQGLLKLEGVKSGKVPLFLVDVEGTMEALRIHMEQEQEFVMLQ